MAFALSLSMVMAAIDGYPNMIGVDANPDLTIKTDDPDIVSVIFYSNATGSWRKLGVQTGTGEFIQGTIGMDRETREYHWRAEIEGVNRTYRFAVNGFDLKWFCSSRLSWRW